jgi:hypothetical protein
MIGPISFQPGQGGPIKPINIPPRTIKRPVQEQSVNAPLTVEFNVQNFGEWQAHFASLGIETVGPAGDNVEPIFAPLPDNPLAPGFWCKFVKYMYLSGERPCRFKRFWCKLLKGPVSCDNCRNDGTDLGTRSLQGAAF